MGKEKISQIVRTKAGLLSANMQLAGKENVWLQTLSQLLLQALVNSVSGEGLVCIIAETKYLAKVTW